MPGAGALAFHRDSAYFDLEPSSVTTVWIALDDMTPSIGPLQYVRGSHAWTQGRVGSAQQFFPDKKNHRSLLLSAATQIGLMESDLDIVAVDVEAGGAGIHNGRLWHGSDANRSTDQPRRGLSVHFVPGSARFASREGRTLAHRQMEAASASWTDQMPDESLFPVTHRGP